MTVPTHTVGEPARDAGPACEPVRDAEPAGSRRRPVLTTRLRALLRVAGGVAILLVVVWRVGGDGFLDGLRAIDPGMLLVATGIGLLTTVLSAWRWQLVARGLGVTLPLPRAVADYYRALFLNAALPGGILGDVHRAVRHGRDVNDLGLGVRAVVLERAAGQVMFVAAGIVVVLAFPGPVTAATPAVLVALAAAAVAGTVVVAVRRWRRRVPARRPATTSRWGRAARTGAAAVRDGLLDRRAWPGIVISSVGVTAGCLATFLVAARAAGVTAPIAELVPLAMLALVAMLIPVNVGGWGPREGVSAWAFAAAGLGATQGLTVAVVYGLSVFVASLPGAGVLLVRWLPRRRPAGGAGPVVLRRGAYVAARPALNRSESA